MHFSGELKAQSVWSLAGNGNWSNAANWNPNVVPDSQTIDVLIDGDAGSNVIVTLDISASVRDLSINSGDQLNILGGRILNMYGNLTNNGNLVVNSNVVAADTYLLFHNSSTVSGNGFITLTRNNSAPNSTLATAAGVTITQSAGHTIQGTGVVTASLINNGTVSANSNGEVLYLHGNNKTNNNLFQATNGGILQISDITLTNTGGTLRADNGMVRLNNTTINGGTLNSLNGGSITAYEGTSTLNNVTLNGDLNIRAGRQLSLSGGMTNNGTITVNPENASADTYLNISESMTIGGTGSIVLNRDTTNPNSTLRTFAGAVLTQSAGHSIRGTGRVDAELINNGTVSADINGASLHLLTNTKTNNGLFSAVNGGLLQAHGLTIHNGNGIVRADAGQVLLHGATITGGTLESLNGGSITAYEGTSTLNSVTFSGNLNVRAGRQLSLSGGMTNNGTITVNPESSSADTYLNISESIMIGGTGSIILNRDSTNPNATLRTFTGAVLTQSAGHSIRGTGRIDAELINNGTVSADINGASLHLLTNTKTNNGLFSAVNGGVMQVHGLTVHNGNGMLRADAGQVLLNGATINGGTLETINGGSMTAYEGTSTLNNVTLSGDLNIRANRQLSLGGGMTNNGTITVNPENASADTYINVIENMTIGGNGSIVLNRDSSNPNATLRTFGNAVLTQASGHTIRGTGLLSANLVNQGTVTADVSGATLYLTNNTITNAGRIGADNGGILHVNSNLIENAGGTIGGDGGHVRLFNTSINGGAIETSNGGTLTVYDGISNLTDLTLNASLNIRAGRQANIFGGLVNNGTITVNLEGSSADTYLTIANSMTIGGNGSIVLNRDSFAPNANLRTLAGAVLTQSAGHSIRGAGLLSADLINQGTVSADVDGATMYLTNNTITNSGILSAENGGILNVNSQLIENIGGSLNANAGHIRLNNTSVNGGTVQPINGGTLTVYEGTSNFTNVTLNGALNIRAGRQLSLLGGFTNNGTITINPEQSSNDTYLNVTETMTIAGNGSIVLNRNSPNPNATLRTFAGAVLTQSPGHSISGTGVLSAELINNGTVSANVNGANLYLTTNVKNNSGVYEAISGGILRSDNGLLANYNAGTQTLSGGTYRVLGDSTMHLVGASVQRLNANVLLDGANSNFFSDNNGTTHVLAPLNEIQTNGQLELRSGRVLTTGGTLVNSGIVHLHGGATQLVVNGNFTQTSGLFELSNQATLVLNGANNELTGGMFVGDGNVSGNLLLAGDTILSPGHSPGQLNFFNDLTWTGGAQIAFDLGADASLSDYILVSGAFNKGGTSPWEFNFFTNGSSLGQTYDLVGFNSTNFDPLDFSFTIDGGFSGFFHFNGNGDSLQFTLTAVPEPSAALLLSLSVAAAMLRRRRHSITGQV